MLLSNRIQLIISVPSTAQFTPAVAYDTWAEALEDAPVGSEMELYIQSHYKFTYTVIETQYVMDGYVDCYFWCRTDCWWLAKCPQCPKEVVLEYPIEAVAVPRGAPGFLEIKNKENMWVQEYTPSPQPRTCEAARHLQHI